MAVDNKDVVGYLRSLHAVRDRCHAVLDNVKAGKGLHFTLDEAKLGGVVDFVQEVMAKNFPEGAASVPFHSRWRHFEPGGVDRAGELVKSWGDLDAKEQARRLLDLAVVSVLLDAGAGPTWKFTEPGTGQVHARSEGLGVASFHMFTAGAFSSDPSQPHRVDGEALCALSVDDIAKGFQVDSETNPLVGLEGRTALLQSLGACLLLEETQEFFKTEAGASRPGGLVDYCFAKSEDGAVSVHDLWYAVMYGFERTWPATRTTLDGVPMGDVWQYSGLPSAGTVARYVDTQTPKTAVGTDLVAFHKLSQWLTYSLMEPLQTSGLKIKDLGAMTGLAEYRNGGLLVDLGLLVPRDPAVLGAAHHPHSDLIVEWRACTVGLLDDLAAVLRERLGVDEDQFPLVKMLEGGTWKAGRVAAKERRPDNSPPIKIISDGTVF